MTGAPSARKRHRRLGALAAATLVAVTWLLTGPVVWAEAGPPVDAGAVVVVAADDLARELTHGRSATEFSLRLPDGAACPGDSQNDQWRVESFVIPVTADPGTLSYGVIGPEGEDQYALYDTYTRPFASALTRPNVVPGEPGVIESIPAFSFAVFPPGTLPSGHYRIGLACTHFRDIATYWDTEIVLTATPDDEPAQLTWRLSSAPQIIAGSDEGSGPWFVVAIGALGALGVAALGWFLLQRTTRHPKTLSKEMQ